MLPEKHIQDDYLRRIAAALPDSGLAFTDIEKLADTIKYPNQPRGWLTSLRRVLQVCVRRKILRFTKGKYYRASKIYMLPSPPIRLPWDNHMPQWPETLRKLGQD